MSLEQDIKNKALELGFDAVGLTDASPIGRDHMEHFLAWLESGCAGPLHYMHRNQEKRIDPTKLLEGARSVIVVALSYKPPVGVTAVGWAPPAGPMGRIAQFAQYEDYHSFIKRLLGELAGIIQNRTGGSHRFKLCVDSSPLAEKALAVRAGLGFIGRNHLLIHPQLGPQILLGELLTTAELAPDEPARGDCGDCDLCLRACPTGALRRDGFFDARECISCLTQYGPSPRTGVWLFGCDECLLACPHQQCAPARANRDFVHHVEWAQVDLREVIELTPEEFDARFADSPMRHMGLERLRQNAATCLKNRG